MRKAEKERKKILVPNSVHTRPEQENSKKNSKKIKNIKKFNFGIISIQKGWQRPRKREKNFSPKFSSYPRRASISKKYS